MQIRHRHGIHVPQEEVSEVKKVINKGFLNKYHINMFPIFNRYGVVVVFSTITKSGSVQM
jgi:hypothetical protein